MPVNKDCGTVMPTCVVSNTAIKTINATHSTKTTNSTNTTNSFDADNSWFHANHFSALHQRGELNQVSAQNPLISLDPLIQLDPDIQLDPHIELEPIKQTSPVNLQARLNDPAPIECESFGGQSPGVLSLALPQPEYFELTDLSHEYRYVIVNLREQIGSLHSNCSPSDVRFCRVLRIKSVEFDEVTGDPHVLVCGVAPVFSSQNNKIKAIIGTVDLRICIPLALYQSSPCDYQPNRFVYLDHFKSDRPPRYLPDTALYGSLVRISADSIPNPFGYVDPTVLTDTLLSIPTLSVIPTATASGTSLATGQSVLCSLYAAFKRLHPLDQRLFAEVLLDRGLLKPFMTIPGAWSEKQSNNPHHVYPGGNAHHCAQMCHQLIEQGLGGVPDTQRSLLILAALTHDLGKCLTITPVGRSSFVLTKYSGFDHDFLSFDLLRDCAAYDPVRHLYLKNALLNKRCYPYATVKREDKRSATEGRSAIAVSNSLNHSARVGG